MVRTENVFFNHLTYFNKSKIEIIFSTFKSQIGVKFFYFIEAFDKWGCIGGTVFR